MKNWEKVFGAEATKPEEIDTTSSPTTVYQRRNVKQVTRTKKDGTKVHGWEREERELTREEYEWMVMMQEVATQNTTEIVTFVTEFQKEAVIDDYTEQLIEEGLI